jgi:hypothetical protein
VTVESFCFHKSPTATKPRNVSGNLIMTHYKDIEKKIFRGLKNTCSDAINFNGTFDANVKPEYLITINIAKSIGELNSYFGAPYLIKLEESTKKFATRCVPNMTQDDKDIFAPTIFRSNTQETHRKGRLDIAVYNEHSEKPLTAIELALVNPAKTKLKADIIRLSEILNLSDNQTGHSKIKYTYFASILFNKKIKVAEQIENYCRKQETKYSNWLKEILETKNIKYEIKIVTIDDSLLFTTDKTIPGDDIFNSDLHYQAKYFGGLIIRLSKKINYR